MASTKNITIYGKTYTALTLYTGYPDCDVLFFSDGNINLGEITISIWTQNQSSGDPASTSYGPPVYACGFAIQKRYRDEPNLTEAHLHGNHPICVTRSDDPQAQIDGWTNIDVMLKGFIWIYTNNGWQKAIPYIYTGVTTNNGWQQSIAYIYKNSTDGFVLCG